MKVTQSGNNAVQAAETSSTKKTDKAKAKGNPTAAERAEATSGARAEISGRAKEAVKAKAVAGEAPDVREAKIAELKRRIDAGKYKVDADAVADRMVNDDIQMFGN